MLLYHVASHDPGCDIGRPMDIAVVVGFSTLVKYVRDTELCYLAMELYNLVATLGSEASRLDHKLELCTYSLA
jgi:hypothetical protein